MPRRGRTAKRLANKKFGELKKIVTFAIPIGNNPVTYCGNSSVGRVEHNLAKVGVASSSLVFRSK